MYKSAHQPQASMHLVSKLPGQFACMYTVLYVFAPKAILITIRIKYL